MPASAAAPPPPLTVLVLAWDAAAPAVRTLIEAAPGLASASLGAMLVLVPPAAETPPVTEALPEPEATPAALSTAPAAPAAPLLPAVAPAQAAASPRQLAALSAPATLPAALAAWEATPAPVAAPQPVVRVTHLVYAAPSGISQFASSTPSQFPAAPYLGATPPPHGPTAAPTVATAAPPALASTETGYSANVPVANAALPPGPVPAASMPAVPAALGPAAYTTEEALAPDPEADLLPGLPAEIPPLAPAQPASDTTAFSVADQAETIQPDSSDGLSMDAEALVEPAAITLPSQALTDFDVNELPTLPVPADEELSPVETPPADQLPEAEPVAVASPPLLPVAANYPAPDLNAQVIRYARFAVPAALSEGPFGAIYAPAWPTWLAALELRQRTGCPLVLHLPALAAGREPADTAAGWPAEIQRQALRQADLVLTETYALARRLRRELGLVSATVRVVPAADGSAVARALRRARHREAR